MARIVALCSQLAVLFMVSQMSQESTAQSPEAKVADEKGRSRMLLVDFAVTGKDGESPEITVTNDGKEQKVTTKKLGTFIASLKEGDVLVCSLPRIPDRYIETIKQFDKQARDNKAATYFLFRRRDDAALKDIVFVRQLMSYDARKGEYDMAFFWNNLYCGRNEKGFQKICKLLSQKKPPAYVAFARSHYGEFPRPPIGSSVFTTKEESFAYKFASHKLARSCNRDRTTIVDLKLKPVRRVPNDDDGADPTNPFKDPFK